MLKITEQDWVRVFEVDHFVLTWRVYNNIVGFEHLQKNRLMILVDVSLESGLNRYQMNGLYTARNIYPFPNHMKTFTGMPLCHGRPTKMETIAKLFLILMIHIVHIRNSMRHCITSKARCILLATTI